MKAGGLTAISLNSHRRGEESRSALTHRDQLRLTTLRSIPGGWFILTSGLWSDWFPTGSQAAAPWRVLLATWLARKQVINAYSPGDITRRKSKDNKPYPDDRKLTLKLRDFRSHSVLPSYLPCMSHTALDFSLHSAQAFAWQQNPAACFLIQNKYT